MSITISQKVRKLRPSASIAAKQKVDELRAQGVEILDFCLGEPDFDTPAHIIEAAHQSMLSGDTHYTGSQGTPALRQAIADKLKRDNGINVPASQIVVANGAKQLIFDIFSATLDPGDEVIIPAPYWVSYPDIVSLNGGEPKIVACGPETGFKLTPDMLEGLITSRTRWLIINSPSNPTGAVYTREEWLDLIEVLKKHPQVGIMTDEIYEHIAFEGVKNHSPMAVDPSVADRCVIVNGMSKAYAMTGWRIGYAVCPPELVKAVVKLLGQSTTCACSFSQSAATVALNADQSCVDDMVVLYTKRRAAIVDGLNAVPGIRCKAPDAAFYVFPDVRALLGSKTAAGERIETDLDLVNYLLEEAHVALMDGTSYGLPGFLRLSFAASEKVIAEGMTAISKAVSKLQLADNPTNQEAAQ
ncbi:aspartate aminotransferase [Cohaesibacter marisflavi]|uniref:Aminotransferase n=1 Tax=Cohaesibacter marisflavi TaxID=655353 RepID=A0A1I5EZN8_9HYPH|nr:pyridoxal phosphate-dependent aminotransferase [Cohaesibacter marisflavi]SFO16883.1 aspartate aminotransferase [Cohaesibacter marisflavi]